MLFILSSRLLLQAAAALDLGVIVFEAARPAGYRNSLGFAIHENGVSEPLSPSLESSSAFHEPRSQWTRATLDRLKK